MWKKVKAYLLIIAVALVLTGLLVKLPLMAASGAILASVIVFIELGRAMFG